MLNNETYLIIKILFIYIIIYKNLNPFKKKIYFDEKFLDILPQFNNSPKNESLLNEIFDRRILFINNKNLTKEYIKYIKPINMTEEKIMRKLYKKKIEYNKCDYSKNKIDYIKYGQLCLEEKLLTSNKIEINKNPLISVILPSFNKKSVIIKSIRSIQNQSLKNIEIIIVDDCSNDNSSYYYKYLLDPRIRVFYHLENMGVWRTRIDGFLYSKGKYIIFFDTGDLYEDNYVLEDAFNIAEKYNLDSVKMLFRIIRDINNLEKYELPFKFNKKFSKIIYKPNIEKYDRKVFGNYTNIWNRLVRRNIVTKGLYLLSTYILNIYKNLWEDIWWNKIENKVSYNFLMIERYGYLYFKDGKGEGTLKSNNEIQKDKAIHEFIHFLYFNWSLLPKRNNKKIIINRLRQHNDTIDRNLNDFKTKFYILDNLLIALLQDRFVSIIDKIFLYKLLKQSIKRQKNI